MQKTEDTPAYHRGGGAELCRRLERTRFLFDAPQVATVSCEAQHMDETLSTLAYADRAKSIVLRAHKNEQISEVPMPARF